MNKIWFLEGRNLGLRGVTKKDLNGPYFEWLNNPRVTRYLQSGLFPNTKEKMKSFFKSCATGTDHLFLAIIHKRSGRHVGNIKLGPIWWAHHFAEIGILIGDERFWGKGYAREATELLLEHAFNRMNLHHITLGVVEANKPALKCYRKMGFRVEGRYREHFRLNGRYGDVILMGMLEKEFRSKR